MIRRIAAPLLLSLMAACSSSDPSTDGCAEGYDGAICVWEGPVIFTREAVHVADDTVFVSAILEWQPCGAEQNGHKERVFRIDSATGATSVAELPKGATTVEGSPDMPIEITLSSGVIVHIEAGKNDSVTATDLAVGELQEPGSETIAIKLPVVCENL